MLPITLLLAGCSGGGGNNASGLLVVTPNAKLHATPVAAKDNIPCQLLPETSPTFVSSLSFAGPCTFDEKAEIQCVNRVDDFYAYINRELPDNGRLAVLINAEKYRGPGTYTHNSLVELQLTEGGILYVWQQRSATMTITKDLHHVIIESTAMPGLAGNPASGVETTEGTAVCQPTLSSPSAAPTS